MKHLLPILFVLPALALADEDADFLAARDAFRSGNAVKLEQVAERLARSPMEPYVTYYRLRMRLETSDPSAIQTYLARPADSPMIDRLRGEWLRQLGKKQQWATFLGEYPRLQTPDVELTCYALQARGQFQAEEVRPLWLVGKEQPDSCAPVFEQALARNLLDEQDIRQRLRLALESGNVSLAKQLTGRLPAGTAPSPAELTSAANHPERYLSQKDLALGSEAERQSALFALLRLAKQSPDLAYQQWLHLHSSFTPTEQRYFYGWLAFESAYRLDPRTMEWYLAAGDAPLNDVQREWRARTALRLQNWRELRLSIEQMSPQQQKEGVWRYWLARCLKLQGKPTEANKLLIELSRDINFYGQLAHDELGTVATAEVSKRAFQPGKDDLRAMEQLPGIARALTLYRLDMRVEASKEWSWALRQFDDRQLITAAELARRNEMYDRAISAADRTVAMHDFNLRYLAPYREELQSHLRDNGLEEAWVYGLMRQESRFVTQAKSNVGAAGLMQIMPATAKWVAKKLGLKSYKQSLIHQMETNLKLGTYYMKTVLGWFDGNPVLASAAYNAGPARARRWRGDAPLEGAIYAETIPYNETRDYVKKVMSNTVYYAAQFGQPQRSLKQRLGTIAARNTVNQQPIPDEH